MSEETEVAKFMAGIKAILTSQPHLIQQYENQTPDEYGKTYFKDVIGRWIETKVKQAADEPDDLFLVPEPALFALKRLGVFTQIPSKGSMTDALNQAGLIRRGKKKIVVQQRMNGHKVYGWQIIGKFLKGAEDKEPTLSGYEDETEEKA